MISLNISFDKKYCRIHLSTSEIMSNFSFDKQSRIFLSVNKQISVLEGYIIEKDDKIYLFFSFFLSTDNLSLTNISVDKRLSVKLAI